MSKKVPSLNYFVILKALRRAGWVIVRQKGSHIRLHKHTSDKILKITIPAHSPIKRSTFAHILKQANMSVEEFEKYL